MKRIISLLLSLTMLLSLTAGLDFSAYAAEAGYCGENVRYCYYDSGTIRIYGTGEMHDGCRMGSSKIEMKNAVIETGVTSIGDETFYNCTSLTSITIPDSVTSIGDHAFCNCTSLTSITIPDSVTSIGAYAFCDCTSLTSVTIPDSVTNIGDAAFASCDNLTSVNVEENNINYYSLGGVLFNQNKDELVCYPAGKSDKTYKIPISVMSIGAYAFYECINLSSVTIPDSATNIGNYAFCNCTGLIGVTIPDNVTSIGRSAFKNCRNFTSVTIPDSVTSIGDYAFKNCTSLKNTVVLSSNCNLGIGFVVTDVKIYGFVKSTANEYATSNKNDFIEIYCNDYGMEHKYSKKVIKILPVKTVEK